MFDIIASHKDDFVVIGTSLIAIASALANIFPKATLLGKIVNFLALNFKK